MMNTQILKLFIVLLSSIFLLSSPVLAGDQGKGKSKSTPPGWEQGKKTGWEGEETPPGLTEEKLDKKQKVKKNKDHQNEAAEHKSKKVKAESESKNKKEKYESEIEAEKEKREAELETEKEKIKVRTKKKEG
jgi:hypothetical protein